MNKKQTFQAMWVPLEKKRPPHNKTLFLGWNEKTGAPILASGIEINIAWDKRSERENMVYNSYFHIQKWMPIYQ